MKMKPACSVLVIVRPGVQITWNPLKPDSGEAGSNVQEMGGIERPWRRYQRRYHLDSRAEVPHLDHYPTKSRDFYGHR
jgi:hypothetical protein